MVLERVAENLIPYAAQGGARRGEQRDLAGACGRQALMTMLPGSPACSGGSPAATGLQPLR
jgi:hypothetical protein